jgi:phage tail sheath protein FI
MATSYLSPGVYVEEVDRGSRPIEAVGTNTVGFLGESRKGTENAAVLITNWSQFVKAFGDFKDCSPALAHAVYGFFGNGGSRCFVVNVGAPLDDAHDTRETRDARYIGRDDGPGARTGLRCFDDVDEIAIVAAPGQTSAAVHDALLTHAETRKDRFAILDAPETITGGVDQLARPRDSKYGAYYFPWISVFDPDKGTIFVPPSGHIAGVYSRIDSERGVHKAPANEIVRGATGLKYTVSKGEQDVLNPRGINAIRSLGGAIRIWGARTLSTDAAWRYVNVRRLFVMVEASVERATSWVVFEPNDHRLWKRVQRTITSFLTLLWRNGALMGAAPEQAFYVKCDDETNPPEVVEAGQLVVEIGLAPLRPAEFIVFRIGQMASGGGVEE